MKRLKELVALVNRSRLQGIKRSDFTIEEGSKLAELYDAVSEGNLLSEEKLIEQLYPDHGSSSSYRKLKHDLTKRLLSLTLLLNSVNDVSNDYQRAYYDCYKEWAVINTLLGKNARHNAIYQAKKLLKKTQKYEFTQLSVLLCRLLRLHYGEREMDTKNFQLYNDLFKKYQKDENYENEVEEFYLFLIVNLSNKPVDEAFEAKADLFYNEVKDALANCHTFRLRFYGYLVELILNASRHDHNASIKICDEAIHFFQQKPFDTYLALQVFFYQKLSACISLKNFGEGEITAQDGLNLTPKGSFNWFKFQELYFLLHLHTGKYQEAYELYLSIIDHDDFKSLNDSSLEIWRIFRAYVYYLILCGKISKKSTDRVFTKFRMAKFLNNTPIYSKDKQGLNISILIIQVLILISEKKYDKVEDKVDAIKQYSYRYLHDNSTYRSKYFIRMILLLPTNNYHTSIIKQKVKRYINKLEEKPANASEQSSFIEIIPYEVLWNLVINNASA